MTDKFSLVNALCLATYRNKSANVQTIKNIFFNNISRIFDYVFKNEV